MRRCHWLTGVSRDRLSNAIDPTRQRDVILRDILSLSVRRICSARGLGRCGSNPLESGDCGLFVDNSGLLPVQT